MLLVASDTVEGLAPGGVVHPVPAAWMRVERICMLSILCYRCVR